MPILFYYLGLKFFFYSNDHEPVHVHVSNGECDAKFMIEPDKTDRKFRSEATGVKTRPHGDRREQRGDY